MFDTTLFIQWVTASSYSTRRFYATSRYLIKQHVRITNVMAARLAKRAWSEYLMSPR